MAEYIFLSPHLDDAVLSCGAIIYDLIHQHHKTVEIWTIFSGDIPGGPLSPFAAELHQRWNTGLEAPKTRRNEDELACSRLGSKPVYLMYPDCIYRQRQKSTKPLIEKNEDLFALNVTEESILVGELTDRLTKVLPEQSTLILPLGVGHHIDHLITRAVGENLPKSKYFYADFPYAGDRPEEIKSTLPSKAIRIPFPLNNQALSAWQYAVEAYTSQISSFWSTISEMYRAIESYAFSEMGNSLWKVD